MSMDPVPTPAAIPAPGVILAVVGTDEAGLPSLAGLTSPSLTCDDAAGVFAFTGNSDQLGATLIPNAGVEGTAVITFTAGTTLADGSAGPQVNAVYVAAVVAGNAVSVTIEATNILPPA